MRKESFARDGLARAEQGIPKLTGAVGKAGYIHGMTPAARAFTQEGLGLLAVGFADRQQPKIFFSPALRRGLRRGNLRLVKAVLRQRIQMEGL
jgi:hypothetical protein